MAVKQKVVECVTPSGQAQSAEIPLQYVIRTLREIAAQNLQEKDEKCAQIVVHLGTIHVPNEPNSYMQFISGIEAIKEILAKECRKYDLIEVALKTLFYEISTCDKPPSPTMSIVLQLIDIKFIRTSVSVVLHSGYSPDSLKRALYSLCFWLTKWTWTENLGPVVLTFMQGLELQHHCDILHEVTLATIEQLFKLLILPKHRNNAGPVVLYMMSLAQHNPETFHKVIPHTNNVVSHLFNENSESSLIYLDKIISICVFLMGRFPQYSNLYEALKKDLQPYLPAISEDVNEKVPANTAKSLVSHYSSVVKVGLDNLGNTCYMNSVLQALFMTKPFRNDVLLYSRQTTPLLSKLQSLFALLQYSKRPSLSPTGIFNLARPPGFLPGHQHDSSEFLAHLLDILHEQENSCNARTENPPSTIVQKTFGGRTVTLSRCGLCGTKSERVDNFRDLQLSFPSNSENQSVQTLLDYYFQPEKLSGENQYRCDVCGCLTDGERVTCIEEAPPRLILTLKHFSYDPASHQRKKLLQTVKLDNYVTLECGQYELSAAVIHSGSSLDSGHYYTIARDDQEWFKFNDALVTRTVSQQLSQLKPPDTAYILLYNRQDYEDPLDLPLNVLPPRLKLLANKDEDDFESDGKRRSLKTYSLRQNKDDDSSPPPGCGGPGFSSNSNNMFVC